MINQFRILYQFLNPRAQSRLLIIILFMIAVGLLDMLSIGMIIPLIEVIAGSSDNFFVMNLNDYFPGSERQQLIITVSLIFAGLFVLKNISLFIMMYTINRFIQFSLAAFQQKMFNIYMMRPYTFHLSRNTAQITRDLTFSCGIAFHGLRQALTIILESILIFTICMLLIIAKPSVTLFTCAIFIIISSIFYKVIGPPMQRWGKAMLDFEGRHFKTINESFGAIKNFKLSHSEHLIQKHYTGITNNLAHYISQTVTFAISPRLFIETTAILLFLGTTLLLIYKHNSLTDIASTIGLFGMAALRLMPSANRILTGATELKNKSAAIIELHRDMVDNASEDSETQSNDETTNISFENSIKFNDVGYQYPEAQDIALHNINLEIKKGDVVGLIGQSGAGKSTLIDILLGFLTPTEGQLCVDDVDVTRCPAGWQLKLGFVPQNIFLLDENVLQNIMVGSNDEEINQDRLNYAIHASQLNSVIDSLPDGIHTNLGEDGMRLSGGQRQRIGIARALYKNPEVLVFDEATSSLDNKSENEINSAIKNLMGDKTIIIIAHRMSSVKFCNKIVFMKDGTILGTGTFDELNRTCEDFRRLIDYSNE